MKENNCEKCPYHHYTYDYWGECDEYCDCMMFTYSSYKKCFYPKIILKVIYIKAKVKQWIWDKQADRNFLKEEKRRYAERIKLGMTEEEYEQWEYDEMVKNSN